MQRWPVRLDPGRGEFRIGPPRRLPLSRPGRRDREDQSGRIVAAANHDHAHIVTPGAEIRVGPLDDCRGVAVSPDGRWLATGSHVRGAQVWRIADGARVAELPIDRTVPRSSSAPMGSGCDPGHAGSGKSAPGARRGEIGGGGLASPPTADWWSSSDPSRIIRLVEIATDRTLARLESPDLCSVWAGRPSAPTGRGWW